MKKFSAIVLIILASITIARAEYCRCSAGTPQYPPFLFFTSGTTVLTGYTHFETYECSMSKSEFKAHKKLCAQECKDYALKNREEFLAYLCRVRSDGFKTNDIKIMASYTVCYDGYFMNAGKWDGTGDALAFEATCPEEND